MTKYVKLDLIWRCNSRTKPVLCSYKVELLYTQMACERRFNFL